MKDFHLEQHAILEIRSKWENEDYERIVALLQESLMNVFIELFEIGVDDGSYHFKMISLMNNLEGDLQLVEFPISSFLAIVQDEIWHASYQDRKEWFEAWIEICPETALKLFEKEIVPALEDHREALQSFLRPYIYEVIPVVKMKDKESATKSLLLAENLINRIERKPEKIGDLQLRVLIKHIEQSNFKETFRMINTYTHLIRTKKLKAKLFKEMPFAVLNVDELHQVIVEVKIFIQNFETNIATPLSSLVLEMKAYLYRTKDLILENPYQEVTTILEYVDKYENEYSQTDDPVALLHIMKMAMELVPNQKVKNEGLELEETVAIWRSIYDQEDTNEYRTLLEELEDLFIEKLLEAAHDRANKLHRILKEQGFYQRIPWNQADQLVQRFVNPRTYAELSKYDDVMRFLRTGEWVYTNHEGLLDETFSIDAGQDLTYMLVCHFKAVETYLYHKVWELGYGEILRKPNGVEILIGNEQHRGQFVNTTLGDYRSFIFEKADRMLKIFNDRDKVASLKKNGYLVDWSDNVRNAHLHKDEICSPTEASKFRGETGRVLNSLVRDLK